MNKEIKLTVVFRYDKKGNVHFPWECIIKDEQYNWNGVGAGKSKIEAFNDAMEGY